MIVPKEGLVWIGGDIHLLYAFKRDSCSCSSTCWCGLSNAEQGIIKTILLFRTLWVCATLVTLTYT